MKKRIKLTESDLHNIVSESVTKVLNELSYGLTQRAYNLSQDTDRPVSKAMQRRLAKNPLAYGERSNNLKQGATNSFNREYGYNLKNVPYGSGDDDNLDVADKSKPFYGGGNLYGPFGNYFNEIGGKLNGDGESQEMYTRRTPQKTFGDRKPWTDSYNEKGLSMKDTITNPKFANAVRKGRNAIDKAHKLR